MPVIGEVNLPAAPAQRRHLAVDLKSSSNE
jgi:hypothetical protein